MMTLFGPLVAVVLVAQAPSERVAVGVVVDENGKPIAGARVVLHTPPSLFLKGETVEAEGVSDGEGKFRFDVPPLGRLYRNGVNVWASREGLAIAAVPYESTKPHQIAVWKPEQAP